MSIADIAALRALLSMQRCALCDGASFETLARQDRHQLGLQTVGCRCCGLVQTNPRPNKAHIGKFYAEHYRKFYQGVTDPSQQYIVSLNKDKRLQYTVSYIFSVLRLGSSSRILDYGCGEGSLFVAMRKAGFAGELMGVELDENFARFAASHGRAQVEKNLANFRDVDCVVINHVLEHLPDPVEVLCRIRTILKNNGALYVDVPDVEEYENVSDLHIAHILHFSDRTLRRVVEAAGYSVEVCEKHHPPFHPRSIRLVARPAAVDVTTQTSGVTERLVWQRIRDLSRRAWRWTIRVRLAGIPAVRIAVQWMRRVMRRQR